MKIEVHALWLAYRDPRVPWYAKMVAACVLAYALSPIDLIPDFIPVLGQLDDILVIPLGASLAFKLVPSDVLAECRQRADAADLRHPADWIGGGVVVAVWIALLVLAGRLVIRAVAR